MRMPKLSFKIYFSLFLTLFIVLSCTDEFEVTSQETDANEILEKPDLQLPENFEQLKAELLEKSVQHNQKLKNQPVPKSNKPIKVPADYPTIQEAVDAAPVGGQVLVSSGTYNETVLVFTNGLSLMSDGDAHLIGGLVVSGENIEIKSFKISATNRIGFLLFNATGVSVKNNSILGSGSRFGFLMDNSSNCSIKNNYSSGHGIVGMLSAGSHHNEFKENYVVNDNYYGLYLQESSNETLKNNVCNENTFGIAIDFSDNNAIIDNEALGNGACDIIEAWSNNNTFRNNTVNCFDSF